LPERIRRGLLDELRLHYLPAHEEEICLMMRFVLSAHPFSNRQDRGAG
jgi:hypothetical protein